MKILYVLFFVLMSWGLHALPDYQDHKQLPDKKVASHVNPLIALINSGNTTELESYVHKHFSPYWSAQMAQTLAYFALIEANHGSLTFYASRDYATPLPQNELVAILYSELTESWLALTLIGNGDKVEIVNVSSANLLSDIELPEAVDLVQASKETADYVTKLAEHIVPPMVNIPAGDFIMGTTGGEKQAQPAHKVSLSAFQLGKYAVTVAEFSKFAAATGYSPDSSCNDFIDAEGLRGPDHKGSGRWDKHRYNYSEYQPVTCISWQDANNYAAWLSEQTGQQYRLPTEQEWEYATKANTTSRYFWGDDPLQTEACQYGNFADLSGEQVNNRLYSYSNKGFIEHLNCDDGEAYNAIVGLYRPNPFGLYDMVGNVSQFLNSCFNPQGYVSDAAADPASCEFLATRGGNWHYPAQPHSNRGRFKREGWNVAAGIGFRLAMDGHSDVVLPGSQKFEQQLNQAQQAHLAMRAPLLAAVEKPSLAERSNGKLLLSWLPSADKRVTGYDIYRSRIKLAHLLAGYYQKHYEKTYTVGADSTELEVSLPDSDGSFIVVARSDQLLGLPSEAVVKLAPAAVATIPGRINMQQLTHLRNAPLYYFAASEDKPERYLVFKTNKATEQNTVTLRFDTEVTKAGWYRLNYKGSSFQNGEFFQLWQGRKLAGRVSYQRDIDDSVSNRHKVYLQAGEQPLELTVLREDFDRWGLSWLELIEAES
ncbi:formylglycine-generating enzyme family protein [Pseudoalteromonas piscicida]|uniref:formylglycine-generating enzyme family protein n=1 Tax=Pseudoalteromonas piscicida TaxID=43662 RepID=UPI0027E5B10E|nr:formylglycine-generating enzyme family protein [Pseudoalteromonas piscicida]WMO14613.1 formylglycine-generating enzyme family protein [Pseudoalteromonas piscicida]